MFRIGFFSWVCEIKISPAISINKKCHRHQWFLASSCEWGLPKLIQGMLPPPMVIAEELGKARSSHLPLLKGSKETGLAPDSWAAYGRIESSESRGLHLPRNRTLNSLTWYLIFDVQTASPFVANFYITWLPFLPAWSSFLRATEILSPGLRVLSIPTKKKNSIRFWLYFLVGKFILLGRRVWMWTKFRCFF